MTMEDSVETAEVPLTTTKEPLKTEDSAAANTGERSDAANSPPPNCSICLGKLVNTSFTDSCLHQFCFTCLLQWSRIKTECPLCKQTFKSIIHNVRSEEDYDQYHVPRELAAPRPPTPSATLEVNYALARASMDVFRRFAYRTTMRTERRHFGLMLNANRVPRSDPNIVLPSESSDDRRHRRPMFTSARRNVYRSVDSSHQYPDMYSRFRDSSADYYRRNPQELDRLIPWINRDLQTLLSSNPAPIAYILSQIRESLTQYDMRSREFHDRLRPYFNVNTGQFIQELINFAQTGLDMWNYDALYVYRHPVHTGSNSGYWDRAHSPQSSISDASSDSDIHVVDRVDRAREGLRLLMSLNEPGPSTVSETFQINTPMSPPAILTISSSSSESECQIVGYVKPRHERTPEMIDLNSSDDGAAANMPDTPRSPSPDRREFNYPSTSQGPSRRNSGSTKSRTRTRAHNFVDLSTSSSSSSTDSDSDYPRITTRSQRRARRQPNHSTRPKIRAVNVPEKSSKSPKKRSKLSSSSTDNKEPKRRRILRSVRSRAFISDSSDEESDVLKKLLDEAESSACSVRVRTDLMVTDSIHTEDSSSSSSSSSSSRSSASTSSTSSFSVVKLRKPSSSRTRQSSSENSKQLRPKLKSTVVKCRPVADKKEWYIAKASSKSRASSTSSYESQDEARYLPSTSEKRSRRAAQKIASERLKDGNLYSTADSQNDDESQRSHSENSTHCDLTLSLNSSSDKRKSKRKGKRNSKRTSNKISTSQSSSTAGTSGHTDKHSDSKSSSKKRNKLSHRKKSKESKQKHTKSKSRRLYSSDEDSDQSTKRTYSFRKNDKRRRSNSFSSTTSSMN